MIGNQIKIHVAARRCLSIVSLLALTSTACSEEPEPSELEVADTDESEEASARPIDSTDPQSSEHFIDADEAAELALSVGRAKTIAEVEPIPDEFGDEVFHVINYAEGGFVIVAADDRLDPVLAFSDEGRFSLDSELFPEGLVGWLSEQKDYVQAVRAGVVDGTAFEPRVLAELVLGENVSDIQAPGQEQGILPGEGCQDEYVAVAPILSTTWGQTGSYNDAIGAMGCDSDDGRPPTGCVATAMAQVMRFHQEPPGFDWASMPNNSGSMATANLMAQVGMAVNMNYGCDGSGASMSNVAPALKNQFGFTSATHASFSWNTVRSELNAGKPVILSGGKQGGWWPFTYYTDGHAWVTDGYRYYFYCETGSTYMYLHMNWGWNGSYNGYYLNNNWNPAGYTFNYQREMVYNIRP